MGAQDETELTRILNALNLNVNVLPEYSNADKIRFVSESALNVSLCWMHDDYFVKYLKDKYNVPYVLAGSIRDDGPLPPVIGDVYEAQDRMRDQIRGATTVLCMATMLHSIAVGNMTPSYRVMADGMVRQVYFYCVDISEFTVNKLCDRGSLTTRGIITNVQDFVVTLSKGLGL